MRAATAVRCLAFGASLAANAAALAGAAPPVPEDWTTPAEASGYRTTPRYDETMAYIQRVAAAAPRQVKLETFGRSGQGRDLWAVVVSRDGVLDPEGLRRAPGPSRPVVLVQNAIHAGEMDGKDSCLALLREIVITRSLARLVDRAVLVIIPVYNADGHERRSRYNRINQNGPEEMGWRTTSTNLNLNRDYMKADAAETRAFLRLFNRWQPDFFVDDHVSDGADYQYDTTYSFNSGPNVFPALARWLKQSFEPYLLKSVGEAGPVIGPYLTFADPNDPAKGALAGHDSPRFSTGYLALQNRPGLLVEMHMLKDYKTRVRGNYELLRAVLEIVNRDADELVRLNREADAATVALPKSGGRVALRLEATGETEPYAFRGYRATRSLSAVSGTMRVEYGKEPLTFEIPRQTALTVAHDVSVPAAYIVPAQWTAVIDVLGAHGLTLRRTAKPWSGEVETYRCETVSWSARPFEGRNVVALTDKKPLETSGSFVPAAEAGAPPGRCRPVRERLDFPVRSVVVPMDQRAAKVALHFLEPEAPDSAVAWGFFNAIFEQKEYGEPYVLEALATEMMAKDPALKAEFEAKVQGDPAFARSPAARLDFFFRRSPFWDPQQGRYPVGRLATLEGVPLLEGKQ